MYSTTLVQNNRKAARKSQRRALHSTVYSYHHLCPCLPSKHTEYVVEMVGTLKAGTILFRTKHLSVENSGCNHFDSDFRVDMEQLL